MTITNLTPDSAILDQLDDQWQKLATMILWKLAGTERVRITTDDMERFSQAFAPGSPTLYTHGHYDAIDFQVIDERAAKRLAEHEMTMRGRG